MTEQIAWCVFHHLRETMQQFYSNLNTIIVLIYTRNMHMNWSFPPLQEKDYVTSI